MKKGQNSNVYIDGANLYKGINQLGWQLDYTRFRVWLNDKYRINRAYLFIGLIPKYKALYTFLQEAGYTLIFKETTYDHDGAPITYLKELRSILALNEKAPGKDETLPGSFS
ncbi:hypothetical protein A3I35_01645 [Candidatus Falkowbacteria bacterium RIFCSPLOWO2_02_FULL_45_15]|uniref:NYN domain-containing protein n=1 Tax=Candidatus Falkowbacteria bacterium RIFCSPLOWO2_02_FULL_45_15 TaxID=1797988 RepID=A0A1F5RX10_9BACT|nr:MAG: hypothetical protein A3I35_01645 [Candidatus Falkowbacteria bacterium RIFCSPLOWO2_02_FULL_45_15]